MDSRRLPRACSERLHIFCHGIFRCGVNGQYTPAQKNSYSQSSCEKKSHDKEVMGEKLDWSSPRDDSDQHDDYGNDQEGSIKKRDRIKF